MRKLAAVALSAALMFPLGAASVSEAASKARKKTRAHKPAPAPEFYRWRPADPSFDQHGRLYQPPPGLPCPIDLGYGRWTSCWNR